MEFSEAGLELLIKKLNRLVESKLKKLSPLEIAALSGKIPESKTLLQFREQRDAFFLKFNDPYPMPTAKSFTEEILSRSTKEVTFPSDSRETLIKFFENEMNRVNHLKEIVQNRCSNLEVAIKVHPSYLLYLDSAAKYICRCEEGISRLRNTEKSSLTTDDLQLELEAAFCQKHRKSMLKALKSSLMAIPITCRDRILGRSFDIMQEYYLKDSKRDVLPVFLTEEREIDAELVSYAKFFDMNTDICACDGQGFLYDSDVIFREFFKNLDIQSWDVRDVEIKQHITEPNLEIDTQNAILTDIAIDFDSENIFKVLEMPKEEVEKRSAIFVQEYAENIHKKLPEYKISALYKLRFTRTKFLLRGVLSMLNYFEFMKYYVQSTEKSEFKVASKSKYQQILNIVDKTGEKVLFKSAITKFDELKNFIIKVCSFYTETVTAEFIESGTTKTIDRFKFIEKILDLLLHYFNAKRDLVQIFTEIYLHTYSHKIKHLIFQIIKEEPNLNLHVYKNIEAAYEIATELTKKKAKLLRFLVNIQISQEKVVGVQLKDTVPLFDRPVLIPNCDVKKKLFSESVPISPFEVYMSLEKVEVFYRLIPKIALDIDESIGIRHSKFYQYMELALWNEFDSMIYNLALKGFFPYNQTSIEFNFPLSPSVSSLFNSFFVNKLDYGNSLIANMNENKKLRFMKSMRRFFLYTWHLQQAIIKTDILQKAYLEQCNVLGNDGSGILMTPFMEVANNDIIDLEKPQDTNIINFGYSEFENITIDFSDDSFIKDIIFAADFDVLGRLITFQQLQNTILELAVRYNSFILDSSFIVNHFGLGGDTGTFMTGAGTEESLSDRAIKQCIAMRIFYSSTTIYRDNVMAKELPKEYSSLSINIIKSQSRTILSAHAKQKSMSVPELLELYRSEMIDSFAPFAYRIEIAKVCNIERKSCLKNNSTDTYIIGPDPKMALIDEAGHFEKFMYIPTWVEVFNMLQTAPHARQSMVLKSLLQFITSRFRIFCIIRVEAALTQRSTQVLSSLYDEKFKLVTPVFQSVLTKISNSPDAKEVEICAKYMTEFERYFFLRFEYGVLSALEEFYVACDVNSDEQKVADPLFSDKIKKLWIQMHEETVLNVGLTTSQQYVPQWENEYVYACVEADREDLATKLQMVDKYCCDSLRIEDIYENIPGAIDFISLSITQIHMKFAFFLLMENSVKPNDLDIRRSVKLMTHEIYSKGSPHWHSEIVIKAVEHLAPKDESISRLIRSVPEPVLAQAIFDVVRNKIDMMMMINQINLVQKQIDDLENLEDPKSYCIDRKDIPKFNENENPEKISENFENEYKSCIAKLVAMNAKIASEVITDNNDGNLDFRIAEYEDKSRALSNVLRLFTIDSISSISSTWNRYISISSKRIIDNEAELRKAKTVADHSLYRFQRQTEATIGNKFHDQYIKLNTLRNDVAKDKQKKLDREAEIQTGIQQEFKHQIEESKKQIFLMKNKKNGVKRDLYDKVFNKINNAKKITINFSGNANTTEVTKRDADVEHKGILKKAEENNENLRKDIIKLHILRVFEDIGVRRCEKKKIIEAEEARKEANAKLWHEKLKTEESQEKMEKTLHDAHLKLCETEQTIAKLKQMLDNEKISNIQLVHWKAKNMKVIDEMNLKIKAFNDDSGVNIDELIEKIETKQKELDQLRKETDGLELSADQTVRRTISSIDTIRDKKRRAKSQMSKFTYIMESDDIDLEEIAQRLSEDNINFKQENQTLKEKIAKLEQQKGSQSSAMLNIMDGVTKQQRAHSRFKSSLRKPGTIVRPNVYRTLPH